MSRSRNKYPIEHLGFVCAEDRNASNKKERIAVKNFLKKDLDLIDEIEITREEELRNNRSPLKHISNLGKCWDKEPNSETFRK